MTYKYVEDNKHLPQWKDIKKYSPEIYNEVVKKAKEILPIADETQKYVLFISTTKSHRVVISTKDYNKIEVGD